MQLVEFSGEFTGGRIGRFLVGLLEPLLTTPGAFVILIGLTIAGLLIAFDMPLRALLSPATRAARAAGTTLQDRTTRATDTVAAAKSRRRARCGRGRRRRSGSWRNRRARARHRASPRWMRRARRRSGAGERPDDGVPYGVQAPPPTSATIAPLRSPTVGRRRTGHGDRRDRPSATPRTSRTPPTRRPAATRSPGSCRRPSCSTSTSCRRPPPAPPRTRSNVWNEARIIEKLKSFDIDARIVGRNAGPVVTQYEVQPAAHIKVSRIEALSDDLSMALAARSIRIEAPIPGKSAVGIEVPNKEFNVVALRRILDEVDFRGSGSTLTFALGRDVAGKAMAVDLAKMPHLLIAGATGSGKSVMVNALITSLLCNATPDDTRMILMDLKRVELAGYNGLPHLLVPVITEPERAKSALKWAVGEMENRYRRFAGATARNIKAFNESRVDPADRLPYIVIVIDELADLMMREGKHVEDPIVRLAQKARATGIHMVLATQRPSVNVVTGLIKANFPSRIAFAMASQIDSRTILDAPGAEDLIGRGDMLYQPSDLPRPMRLQGVFVSDPEIGRVTDHWRGQIEDPHYDLAIVAGDEDSTGSVDDLADEEADRLLPDAV